MGEIEPDEGSFKWGVTTSQSYFPKDNTAFFENFDVQLDRLAAAVFAPTRPKPICGAFWAGCCFQRRRGIQARQGAVRR